MSAITIATCKTKKALNPQQIKTLENRLRNVFSEFDGELDIDFLSSDVENKSQTPDKTAKLEKIIQEIESSPDFDPQATQTTSQKLTSQEFENLSSF